jgi:L-fuconolactonase
MPCIDAHQHFWKFDPIRDSWITDDMAAIQRDFMPPDLLPILLGNGIDGSVIVQSAQTEQENDFQLANAAANDFVKGVVGWVDLQSDDVANRLTHYKQFKKMKGFRHVLQDETDRALMLKPAFKRGVRLLKRFGFTYDILIFPDQLLYAAEFVAAFPGQPFVIDHIAKPFIKDRKIEDWKKDIQLVARFENVSCKISGMVTEADWQKWKPADFKPYLDVIVEAFGIKRIMFGSDWPVCLVASSYSEMMNVVKDYFLSFSHNEQDLFFGNNAISFYNLE